MLTLAKEPILQRNGRSSMQRIVIMRALPGLGDFLCAVPAFRALRSAFPKAHIALIGLPETWPLVSRFSHYLDELIPFPGFPGLKEKKPDIPQLLAFLAFMQGRFDLALQMHGSGYITNTFVNLLGANHVAGFYESIHSCPDENTFLPYPTHLSEVDRCLSLLKFLGIPVGNGNLEFPLGNGDHADFALLQRQRPFPSRPYICLHPGASHPEKCWSPASFAGLGDALAAQGFEIVLTGTSSEKSLTRRIAQKMKHPVIDLTGCTSLGVLALLLQGSRLLVCNDTGVSHLAAALKTPSVVIFHPSTEVNRWAPRNQALHRAIVAVPKNGRLSARPFNCADGQRDMPEVTAVLAQVQSLLNQEKVYVD